MLTRSSGGIDCPACHREIAAEFGDWLWHLRNCPFCLTPLTANEGEAALNEPKFYFIEQELA